LTKQRLFWQDGEAVKRNDMQNTNDWAVWNAGELPNYGVLVLADSNGDWALAFDYDRFGLSHLLANGDHPAHERLVKAFEEIASVVREETK